MIPANRPLTPRGPKSTPMRSGDPRTRIPGAIIFEIDAYVEMAMHFS